MSTQSHALLANGLSLRAILPDANLVGANDLQVRSCCGVWQECQRNDVYVAIVGVDSDGHDFAQEAIKRGAIAVVTERLLAIDRPQFLVDDSRQAYGKICQALAGNPANRLTTIGVSGSDGKTVTARLIDSILSTAGRNPVTATSLVESEQLENSVSLRGELNSPRLANWLADAVAAQNTHAIIEIHSQSLAQHCLTGTALDVAVLTNLRNDHLDFHGSGDNYRRVQQRLLGYVKPEGVAVVNADDPNTCRVLDQLDLPALTVGIHHSAEFTAKLLEQNSAEQIFLLSAGNDSAIVRSQMIGKHHVYNCLVAAAVGFANGVDLPTIVRGLEQVGQIPGRLERVICGQAFDVWIDSAARPNQLASAIHAVRQLTNGRVWVVATTDPSQSNGQRRRIGEILEKAADYSIITQASTNNVVDFEPAHQVLDGYHSRNNVRSIPNRFRAIEWTLEQASTNDSVLITGLGDRPVAIVGSGKWPVTDRDICQAWLFDRHSFCPPKFGFSRPEIFRFGDHHEG